MLSKKQVENLLQKLEKNQITHDEIVALEKYADEQIAQNNQPVFLSEFEKQKIKQQIFHNLKKQVKINRLSFSPLKLVASIAAFLVLSVTIGILVNSYLFSYNVYAETSIGQIKTIELPDGTQVTLNALSTILLPQNYNNSTRKVKFNGEATFKVKHMPSKPFIIETNGIKTKVLGTTFNLKSYVEDSLTVVSLLEGKVEVTNQKGNLKLLPNEAIELKPNTVNLNVTKFNANDALAWQNKELILAKTTFKQLKNLLYRSYGVEIIFSDNTIANQTISGRFTNPNLQTILQTVCAAKSLQFKFSGNNQVIIF